MRSEKLGEIRGAVIKVGTSSITNDDFQVDAEFMDSVARQVKWIRSRGMEAIVVTSGAIGIGLDAMEVVPKPKEVPIRQAAASVGQSILMQRWAESFAKVDLKIAQVLLTYDFYSDRVRYLNVRNTLNTLLENGVIPVINENDAVCIKEIEAVFGDNDTLSAMVASKLDSDILIILSDVDGLYDRNPRVHADAELISEVHSIDDTIESFAGRPSTTRGVGGMRTKIQAARICNMAGCHMVIANHSEEDVIIRVLQGEEIGTLFVADGEVRRIRTRWILLAHSNGTIDVDEGARRALTERHMGLLPSGVKGVHGSFRRGDVVDIRCDGEVFAKGISDYDHEELRKVMGAHSNRIESILGYKNYDNVVRGGNIAIRA